MICKVTVCDQEARWHVLRAPRHDPIFGIVHDGASWVPEHVNHQRQAEFCVDHARAEADWRNFEEKMIANGEATQKAIDKLREVRYA